MSESIASIASNMLNCFVMEHLTKEQCLELAHEILERVNIQVETLDDCLVNVDLGKIKRDLKKAANCVDAILNQPS